MMAQVVLDEGRDEVIAVVVARLAAQRQRVACILACLLETLGHQLLLQKRVRKALVHEDRRPAGDARQCADELAGVVFLPELALRAEVSREGLLAPWTVHRDRKSTRLNSSH